MLWSPIISHSQISPQWASSNSILPHKCYYQFMSSAVSAPSKQSVALALWNSVAPAIEICLQPQFSMCTRKVIHF